MQNEQTLSEKSFEFIKSAIANGLTVYLTNARKSFVISPKTFAKWNKSKTPLFKFDSEGSLRMCNGKSYDIIFSNKIAYVKITAQ